MYTDYIFPVLILEENSCIGQVDGEIKYDKCHLFWRYFSSSTTEKIPWSLKPVGTLYTFGFLHVAPPGWESPESLLGVWSQWHFKSTAWIWIFLLTVLCIYKELDFFFFFCKKTGDCIANHSLFEAKRQTRGGGKHRHELSLSLSLALILISANWLPFLYSTLPDADKTGPIQKLHLENLNRQWHVVMSDVEL